ncbi:hypothetical protein B0O99DRAFT_626836 [Bisporella sp. PMI_857]|nr:hypothetical protein B0O99DRAFT_626836 [Bisporella sp. PMI_857]
MPLNDILATITGEPSPTTTHFPPTSSSRAQKKPGAIVRKQPSTIANSSRPISDPRGPPAAESKQLANKKPVSSPAAAASSKYAQPTTPVSSEPSRPPKKGSFAEIMARAKTLQSTQNQIGKIQHKKIEKVPRKKEREIEKEKRANNVRSALDPKSKFQRPSQPPLRDGKTGVRQNTSKQSAEPEKKVKKAATATTGYAGTARPKLGDNGAKAPSRPATSSSSRFGRDRGRYDRYLSEDEEDDELIDDDEPDYYSDESDMEAAAFEVDEEEEMAAKLAAKEDREALAEENRLKMEKLERKRKMAEMAKKVKPRY